jgi:hypothetical protein
VANVGEQVTDETPRPTPRPLIERLGLGAIALVIAGLFGTVAVVTLANGEIFLGVMAATGALMTMWAALTTLRRG